MKLKVFYSWQSDLPNNSNRGFIEKCLIEALKVVHNKNLLISEWVIDSDSRGESGTPELASNIFSKIDQCDIFIADISIIAESSKRKVSNPNVLIELGYASSRLGWERILCLYNLNYGGFDDLPFDVKHRKPLSYKEDKIALTKLLVEQINSIVVNHISDKKYYTSLKRDIDLTLQSILIDISKLIFFNNGEKKYNYSLILHLTQEELEYELFEKKIYGFQVLKRDYSTLVDEFIKFYNDQIHLNFFNEIERRTLAKIILEYKNFTKVLMDLDNYNILDNDDNVTLADSHKVNQDNPIGSFLVLRKIKDNKHVVIDSGQFITSQLKIASHHLVFQSDAIKIIIYAITELCFQINEWIRISGSYFIFNQRQIEK